MANELRFAGDANAARDADFIACARAALRLPGDAQLDFQAAHPEGDGHTVEYQVTAPVTLQGDEFGPANGVTVDERAVASLRFDAQGNLVGTRVRPVDERHLQLVKDQVRKLAAAGGIGTGPSAGAPGLVRKPWYIETDAQGRKRLKRAYMS